jgi:hypothetical protein
MFYYEVRKEGKLPILKIDNYENSEFAQTGSYKKNIVLKSILLMNLLLKS